MFKVRWLVLGVLGLLVVALATTTTSQVSQAQGEKIYRLGMFSDIRAGNTMHYIRSATVYDAYTLGMRHCGLFSLSYTRFYFIPSLAASIPYKPGTAELDFKKEGDLFTLVIDLKKNVKWSDGSDVTADDVLFSYIEAPTIFGKGDFVKGVAALGGGWSASLNTEFLAKAEKTGTHQVKFFFKKLGIPVQWDVLLDASIFQKKYWAPKFTETAGDRVKLEGLAAFDEPGCGWGVMPEALNVPGKGHERGAAVTNVANPNYFWKGVKVDERNAAGNYTEEKAGVYSYSQPVPAAAGPELARYETGPFVDRASYRVFADTSSVVASLVRGDIDFMINPLGADPGVRAQFKAEPKIKTQDQKSHGMFYQAFNHRRKPMGSGALQKDAKYKDDDVAGSRFRTAWSCLIDREFVTKTLFQGVAFELATAVSPANSFWFDGALKAPCAEFSEQTDPRAGRAKKLDVAVKILKSAGFTWGREPKADTATGVVTAGEGLIMPVVLGSKELKLAPGASATEKGPAGTIAMGAWGRAFAKLSTTCDVAWPLDKKADAAGRLTCAGDTIALKNDDTKELTVKVYFYGKGDRVPTINFIYPNSAYDPRRALLGVQTERWLNQAGVPVRGVPTGFNVIVTKVFDEQDFDVWSLGWSLGGLTPPTYVESFFHTRYTDIGDDNAQGYSNPDVDAMLDRFLEELDLNKARDLVLQIQRILLADGPYAPAFDTIIVDAWRDDKVVYPFTERTQGIVGAGGLASLVKLR